MTTPDHSSSAAAGDYRHPQHLVYANGIDSGSVDMVLRCTHRPDESQDQWYRPWNQIGKCWLQRMWEGVGAELILDYRGVVSFPMTAHVVGRDEEMSIEVQTIPAYMEVANDAC